MAFPPNYRQGRNDRLRAKQEKTARKQAEREERRLYKKQGQPADEGGEVLASEAAPDTVTGCEAD